MRLGSYHSSTNSASTLRLLLRYRLRHCSEQAPVAMARPRVTLRHCLRRRRRRRRRRPNTIPTKTSTSTIRMALLRMAKEQHRWFGMIGFGASHSTVCTQSPAHNPPAALQPTLQWRVVVGKSTSVSYGRIGGKQTTQLKGHSSEADAYAFTSKAIKQKATSGYRIDLSTVTPSRAPAPATRSTPLQSPAPHHYYTASESFDQAVVQPTTPTIPDQQPPLPSPVPPAATSLQDNFATTTNSNRSTIEAYEGHLLLVQWLSDSNLATLADAFVAQELTLDDVGVYAPTTTTSKQLLHLSNSSLIALCTNSQWY
jgi:predicted DNA-binding WGR domain protein